MRRAIGVASLFFCCAMAARAQGGGGTWVDVERRELLAGSRSADDVKREALYGALAEAVRRVVGVKVQVGEFAERAESGGRVVERYLEAVRLDAAGRATEWAVLSEGWRVEKGSATGPQTYYELRLRVRVERERGTADPAFSVRLAANAGRLVVRGDDPSSNDEVVATVTCSQDAVITLVSIVEDSVFVLAPNEFMPAVRAVAGRAMEVPDAAIRRTGLRFRASLPSGATARSELLAVVATRVPVVLPAAAGSGGARDTRALTLAEFNAWMVGIPLQDRAVAQVALDVQRAP